jgi:MFS family permease
VIKARTTLRGIATVIGMADSPPRSCTSILIFMPDYAVRELQLEQAVPLLSTLIASTLLVLLLVPMGHLCDRLGAKPLILAASTVGTALVVPLTWHLTASAVARFPPPPSVLTLRLPRDVRNELRTDGGEPFPGIATLARHRPGLQRRRHRLRRIRSVHHRMADPRER